jgi:N6-adenosine-specific RNA methylase IME4
MGVWAKQSSTGASWAFGTGYRRRSAAEPYLIGTMGKPTMRVHNVRNLLVAPVREHFPQAGPDARRDRGGDAGPYVELFAREQSPGWEAWGNQTDKFNATGKN